MKSILLLGWLVLGGMTGWSEAVKRPAITGVAFARFYTTNVPAAEHFYGDTLGYEKREIDDRLVYPVNRSQWIELLTSTPPREDRRLAAVAFTTRDAAGLLRYLDEHGVKAELPLHAGEFGVRDPEGNLVIFVQAGSQRIVADAPEAARAASRRMIHVGFIVQDRAKEDAFWRDLLGFRVYWTGWYDPSKVDWVCMQVPDGTDWLEYMLGLGTASTLKQAGVADHISLGVTHIADAIDALAKNHCAGEGCTKTREGRDGKVQLTQFDPDLTRIEFMEYVATKTPCCTPVSGSPPGPVENK